MASSRSHFLTVLMNQFGNPLHLSKLLISSPSIANTHHLLDQIPHPSPHLYNTLIHSLSSHHHHLSLHVYSRMLRHGLLPLSSTLPPLLKAIPALSNLFLGRAIHAHILRFGFVSDLFLHNGLISMYSKCGNLSMAHRVFDRLRKTNVVSWTSIVSGSAQNGFPLESLRLFRKMRSLSNVRPDFVMMVSVLSALTDVEDLEVGRAAHGLVLKGGFHEEQDVIITVTAMYAKCGHVDVARSLFDKVSNPDVILWNAMISGYAKNGYGDEAVELFRKMVTTRNKKPDSITIRAAILACAQMGSLETARWMEDYTHGSELRGDVFVNTALIDMYAKCGSMDNAHAIFHRIADKDVVVWSAMIAGYGLHGRGHEAIELFHQMKHARIMPNDVTFVGLLSACNHAGLVEEGWKYFHSMRDYGIEPRHQHYACVVDLLARAGLVRDAYEFIMNMPMEPEITVWGALLTSCKIYNHVELGEYAAKHIFAMDPLNAGHYVQLSNIYASSGLWNDVAKVRVMMKERGVSKDVGCSLIEMNGKLQSFNVWDKSHPKSKEIFEMLSLVDRKLKEFRFL